MSISSDDIYHIFLSQPKIPLDIAHGYTPVESSQFWCSHWRQTAKLTPWHPISSNDLKGLLYELKIGLKWLEQFWPWFHPGLFHLRPATCTAFLLQLLPHQQQRRLHPPAAAIGYRISFATPGWRIIIVVMIVMGYENGKTHWATKWAMGRIGFRIHSEKHAPPELCDKLDEMQPLGASWILRDFSLLRLVWVIAFCAEAIHGNTAWQNQEISRTWY